MNPSNSDYPIDIGKLKEILDAALPCPVPLCGGDSGAFMDQSCNVHVKCSKCGFSLKSLEAWNNRNPNWKSIKTAPTSDESFYVGFWDGIRTYDENYTQTGWESPPVWTYGISHHENPHRDDVGRGWNHRNGLFNGRATHWHPMISLGRPPHDDKIT